jgi:hypothetical protein
MARPVVVDTTARRVHVHRGKPAIGRVYADHLIEKADRYFHGG